MSSVRGSLGDWKILEGIVTTVDAVGRVHIAPMGPEVDPQWDTLVLRPYQSSLTYGNLKRTRQGVLHVTDDVELIARAAVGQLEMQPAVIPATRVEGYILADACRWFAFRVVEVDNSGQPTRMHARVVDRGRTRDFFGFNRAKHAVLEAAILATRLGHFAREEIEAEFDRLARPVARTAGRQERRAFDFLQNYVRAALAERNQSEE